MRIILALTAGVLVIGCPSPRVTDGKSDVGACATDNGGCDPNATCSLDAGQVLCTCKTGYEVSGTSCSPIDSCSMNNGGCDEHATCASTGPGTNSCTCNAPYTGNGTVCTRSGDPCVPNPCGEDTFCILADGGAVCACLPGYVGDAGSCLTAVDAGLPDAGSIDAGPSSNCATNNPCGANATCSTDSEGTIFCTCDFGYVVDGGTCAAVDSCDTNNGNCSSNATCTSTGPGTNSCMCNTGYSGDGQTCMPYGSLTCPGVTCTDGGCQPVQLASSPTIYPSLILANATDVYWATASEVLTVPMIGGTALSFAAVVGGGGDSGAYGMAIDSSNLYFTDYGAGQAKAVALATGDLTILGSGSYPHAMTVSQGDVFWSDYGDGDIQEVPVGGSPATFVDPMGTYNYVSLAADEENLYWSSLPYTTTNQGTVAQISLDGSNAITLATDQYGPTGIAVGGGNVYWTNLEASGPVVMAPIGGGTVTTLSSDEADPQSPVTDSNYVYWLDNSSTSSGAVRYCPLTGCGTSPRTLVTTSVALVGITVNDACLFWVDTTGNVYKTGKP